MCLVGKLVRVSTTLGDGCPQHLVSSVPTSGEECSTAFCFLLNEYEVLLAVYCWWFSSSPKLQMFSWVQTSSWIRFNSWNCFCFRYLRNVAVLSTYVPISLQLPLTWFLWYYKEGWLIVMENFILHVKSWFLWFPVKFFDGEFYSSWDSEMGIVSTIEVI